MMEPVPLRPNADDAPVHALYPGSVGLVLRLARGALRIDLRLDWSCRVTDDEGIARLERYQASAPVTVNWNGADVLTCHIAALQAALDAATPICRWRVSSRCLDGPRLVIECANESASASAGDRHDEPPLFFDTRVAVAFSPAPPLTWTSLNCVRGDQHAGHPHETTLISCSLASQRDGASREQPPAPLDRLREDPLPVLRELAYAIDSPAFDRGLAVLDRDEAARIAFQCTCDTVQRQFGAEDPDSRNRWRLFHVIFLIDLLGELFGAEIAEPAANEVDVAYFPTGRGKTEALLGTLVLVAFRERLRGRRSGMSTWTRFPVRLLSAPLIQTAVNTICTAELVRRSQPRLQQAAGDGFAIGLIGVAAPAIQHCPACRTASVRADVDSARDCTIHRCTRPGCAFPNGEIPVYCERSAIFRYLPSAIIGTLDTLSGPVVEHELEAALGRVTSRCPRHGFGQAPCPACAAPVEHVFDDRLSRPIVFVPDHHRPMPLRTRGTLAHGDSI